jgi:hypothetical protein
MNLNLNHIYLSYFRVYKGTIEIADANVTYILYLQISIPVSSEHCTIITMELKSKNIVLTHILNHIVAITGTEESKYPLKHPNKLDVHKILSMVENINATGGAEN